MNILISILYSELTIENKHCQSGHTATQYSELTIENTVKMDQLTIHITQ